MRARCKEIASSAPRRVADSNGPLPDLVIDRADASETSKLDGTEVVADVNGEPILASEVFERAYCTPLEPDHMSLKAAAEELKAGRLREDEYRQLQEIAIRTYLHDLIRTRRLTQALLENLDEEQTRHLETQISKMFEEYAGKARSRICTSRPGNRSPPNCRARVSRSTTSVRNSAAGCWPTNICENSNRRLPSAATRWRRTTATTSTSTASPKKSAGSSWKSASSGTAIGNRRGARRTGKSRVAARREFHQRRAEVLRRSPRRGGDRVFASHGLRSAPPARRPTGGRRSTRPTTRTWRTRFIKLRPATT